MEKRIVIINLPNGIAGNGFFQKLQPISLHYTVLENITKPSDWAEAINCCMQKKRQNDFRKGKVNRL